MRLRSMPLCTQRKRACFDSCTWRMTSPFGFENHSSEQVWRPGAAVVVFFREEIVISMQEELGSCFGPPVIHPSGLGCSVGYCSSRTVSSQDLQRSRSPGLPFRTRNSTRCFSSRHTRHLAMYHGWSKVLFRFMANLLREVETSNFVISILRRVV